MRKLKGMSAVLCGVLAAAMITVSISAPASAAPKKYVTEISSVKVDGRTVKKNATYKMYIGDTAKIKAAVKVKGKATKKVTFSSSKASVAAVTKDGKISAKKDGTSTITVKTVGTNKSGKTLSYRFKVKVSGYVKSIAGVKVDGESVKKNETYNMYVKSDEYGDAKVSADVSVRGKASEAVTYKSSDSKVASISSKGKITAKKAGTAKITVTSKAVNNKGKKVSYTFKVKVYSTYVVGVPGKDTLVRTGSTKNPTTKLEVEIRNLKSSTIKVTSSKSSVVSVKKKSSKNWVLTGKKAGTATITVKASQGKKSFKSSLKITVKDQKATGLSFSKKSTMTVGENYAINAKVSGNPVVGGYAVTSNNTKVAAVSGTTITAKSAGTATITVQTKDKAKKASYTLTVKPVSETLAVTTASELKGFTLSDIQISNVEYLLEKDVPGFAEAIGIVKPNQSLVITVGDTVLKATYNADGTMSYTRNGEPLKSNADIFKDISIKAGESVILPNNARVSEIITGMASARCTTASYNVSCVVNGTAVSASNVKFSNGTVTFTTEGINYQAVAAVSGGKHTLTVTNKSNSAVKFSATKLGKAMKAVGIY